MARFIEPVTNQNERCFRCYIVFYKFQSVIFNIFFIFLHCGGVKCSKVHLEKCHATPSCLILRGIIESPYRVAWI